MASSLLNMLSLKCLQAVPRRVVQQAVEYPSLKLGERSGLEIEWRDRAPRNPAF